MYRSLLPSPQRHDRVDGRVFGIEHHRTGNSGPETAPARTAPPSSHPTVALIGEVEVWRAAITRSRFGQRVTGWSAMESRFGRVHAVWCAAPRTYRPRHPAAPRIPVDTQLLPGPATSKVAVVLDSRER
jgi:hypothetical protein